MVGSTVANRSRSSLLGTCEGEDTGFEGIEELLLFDDEAKWNKDDLLLLLENRGDKEPKDEFEVAGDRVWK